MRVWPFASGIMLNLTKEMAATDVRPSIAKSSFLMGPHLVVTADVVATSISYQHPI